MRIKIHEPVEFEKIIPNEWVESIAITRQRLALQQMLDSGDQEEYIVQRVTDYCKSADKALTYIAKHAHEPLLAQPLFQWEVDHHVIVSPCWRFEAIMPRILLASVHLKKAHTYMKHGQYKDAHSCYTKTKELHEECIEQLQRWTWKIPEMNHIVLQTPWHKAHTHLCQGFIHLATLCVGLDRDTSSNVLYIVSQRALRSFSNAVADWTYIQVPLQLAECMRYYFSSNILWNAEQYGASIFRLQTWVHQQNVDASYVPRLAQELNTVSQLLDERKQTNNGAYFDVIKDSLPLPPPETLIHMESSDMPHPQVTHQDASLDVVHIMNEET